jgi:hypothetical protein
LILHNEGEQHHHQPQQQADIPLAVVEDDVVDPNEENDAIYNEEEDVAEDMAQVREENQQNLVNHALTLDVVGTSQNNHPLKQNAPGTVMLHERRQLNPEERVLVCFYAVYLMGWQNNITKAGKQIIQEAVLTLLCYNQGYKKVVGASQVEHWIKI